jgi:hypothetical protein
MRVIAQVEFVRNGHFLDVEEFHDLMAAIGLAPADIPLGRWGNPDDRGALHDYFEERSEGIIELMPKDKPDEIERVNFTRENVVYASTLSSSTPFMVVRETNARYLFRLHNSRLASLQTAADKLVEKLGTTDAEVRYEDDITVFEHGLDEPTIGGRPMIGAGRWARFKTARRAAWLPFALAIICVFLFGLSTLVPLAIELDPASAWKGFFDRMATASLMSFATSAVTFWFAGVRQTGPIDWDWTTRGRARGR